MDDKEKKKILAAVLHGSMSAVFKRYAPRWSARADVLKTLASLSSASIVLSVTFSATLRTLQTGYFWRYLLLLSFTMFALSLISALACLWFGINLHWNPEDFVTEEQVRTQLDAFNLQDLAVPATEETALDHPFAKVLFGLPDPVIRRHHRTERLALMSFICFGLAIISLTLVGFRQLLP